MPCKSRFQIPNSPSPKPTAIDLLPSFVNPGPAFPTVRSPSFDRRPQSQLALLHYASSQSLPTESNAQEESIPFGATPGKSRWTDATARRHRKRNERILEKSKNEKFEVVVKKEVPVELPRLVRHSLKAPLEKTFAADQNPFVEEEEDTDREENENRSGRNSPTRRRPGDRLAQKSVFGEDSIDSLIMKHPRSEKKEFRDVLKKQLHEAAVLIGESELDEIIREREREAQELLEAEQKRMAEEKARPVLGLTRKLQIIAPTRDATLTEVAERYIELSRIQRRKEASEIEARLARAESTKTSFSDPNIPFDDFVVVRRLFDKYALHGTLRVLQIPQAGWAFCDKILNGPVARRLDRDHSGQLKLSDVFRFLHPSLSVETISERLQRHQTAYEELLAVGSSLPVLDRLNEEQINDYARVFSRVDPTLRGRMSLQHFISLANGSELVGKHDIRKMFDSGKKVDGVTGEEFLDFEGFVSTLHVFPRQFKETSFDFGGDQASPASPTSTTGSPASPHASGATSTLIRKATAKHLYFT